MALWCVSLLLLLASGTSAAEVEERDRNLVDQEAFLRQFFSDPKDTPSTETWALTIPTVSPPVTTENIPAVSPPVATENTPTVSPPATTLGAFIEQPADGANEGVQFRATFAPLKVFDRSEQPSTEPSSKPSAAPSTVPSGERTLFHRRTIQPPVAGT
jgi:hypothetical protein